MARAEGGVSIQRRGSRAWQVNVYDGPSSKRRVRTFKSFREASDWEAGEKLRRRTREGDLTVALFAETWLERYPRPKRSTEVAYAQGVKGFVKQFGRVRLHDLTRHQVRLWAIGHPSQAPTARTMLGDAFRDGLIGANPLAGMRLPGGRGRRDIEALSEQQVARLVECAGEVHGDWGRLVYGPMIQLAAYTGLRPGELHGLRWGDVSLRDGTLRVERQYSPKAHAFTATKNELARTVPVLPPAEDALRAIPRTGEQVFFTKQGRHFTGRVSSFYWSPVRAAFGDSTLDFYALRHACGSMLARMGLGAPEIARILGHVDGGRLALETYIHVSESEAVDKAKLLYSMPRLKAVGE